MKKKNNKIILFGDKRHRETRLRQSVFSIDDTDFLMEVRSARRRSIETMTNDDILLSSRSPSNWNRIWNDFSISPENIRNVFPLNKGKNGEREVEEKEKSILVEPIPDLLPRKNSDKNVATVDKSSSSNETPLSNPSSSLKPPSSSVASCTHNPDTIEPTHPAWYNRLGAIARRERQQEKDYHDTLDEHQKAKTAKALRQYQNHPYFKNWQRRQSSRDGLDFSRDVALALRHDSIYAMADSFTLLPSQDALTTDNDMPNDNENVDNGYIQYTRPAGNPKTKKCVLDLIA